MVEAKPQMDIYGDMRMKSIISNEKECFICHSTQNLEQHHCILGTANRKLADKYGLWVWLCQLHHTGAQGVHTCRSDLKKDLQRMAQEVFEQTHTREEFREIFGKSYL